jgi:hypothetical protein
MQLARDAASLVILHRHQTGGKSPQRSRSLIHFSLQFDRALTHGMLHQFAIMDVGTGAIPSGYLICLISNGYCADAKPTIFPVLAPQAVLALIIFA